MVPSYSGLPCTFSCVSGLVQSLVPSASPTKFATVTGACLSKSRQVIRPMLVSITAVGPVGSTAGAACVLGESGRSYVAPDGALLAGAAGACSGAAGGGVCCAEANALEKRRARANRRAKGMLESNIPEYRKHFQLCQCHLNRRSPV